MRTYSTKLGKLSVLLVVLSLILTACGGAAQTPADKPTQASQPADSSPATAPASSGSAATGDKVKIVFWSHDFAPREKLDRQYMDQFMKDNPNVEVEYILGPGDDTQYITKLMTAMAGGQGPDCFNLLTLGAGPVLAQGMAVPLDPKLFGYNSVDEMKNAYVEGTLEGFVYNDQLYAVPSEVSIYSTFVNKQMFQDAGLDPDKDYPTTWEKLLEVAPKINKVENGNLAKRAFDFTYGMPDDVTSPIFTAAGMAHQLGGQLLSDDGKEALVNSEPWVRTFKFIQDWVYQHKFGDPALTVGFIDFYQGNMAMFVSGSWYSSYIKEQNQAVFDVHTIKPLPRWSDAVNNTGAYMYAYGLFTNSASAPEKQQACQKLVSELSKHPEEYLKETGLLQPTKSLAQTETFKNTPGLDVFMKDMVGTPFWPAHPKSFEMLDALTRALQRVVTEQADVQESLNTAKSEMDALLAQP